MIETALLDTGPLVALLDEDEENHVWAADAFRRVRGPFLTCEPVITETMFLLRNAPAAQDKVLEWLVRGSLSIPFDLAEEAGTVLQLQRKFRDVPMSLADACLVRMAEMFENASVCTLDTDFRVYRKHGKAQIQLIIPES